MTELDLDTPRGAARVHLHPAARPRAALVLGHGAAVGVDGPDLVAVTEVALAQKCSVALVEQPYWVAGRRSPAPVAHLDEAWTSVVEQLAAEDLKGLDLVAGGRSLGARVACRTAEETGAVAVLCLAFPLEAPRRSGPAKSRLDELEAVRVPTLVVQGEKDQFGMPPEGPRRTVTRVPGNHSLRADLAAVADAVRAWLPGVL